MHLECIIGLGRARHIEARYTGHRKLTTLQLSCANRNMGVWRSGSACRLQRQTGAIFPQAVTSRNSHSCKVCPEYIVSAK
jgi:hypothetical protein